MAIVVEHEKRKEEILERALDVFVENGYDDSTYQKFADKCNLTRTTLYIYFKNKREIFLKSIKQLVARLEVTLTKTIKDESLTSEECLRKVLMQIIDSISAHKYFFRVLIDYLAQLEKAGIDPYERVSHRIIRLRHIMSNLIIAGQKKGEFRKMNVKLINNLFYGLIESSIFSISILTKDNFDNIRDVLNLAVDGILVSKK